MTLWRGGAPLPGARGGERAGERLEDADLVLALELGLGGRDRQGGEQGEDRDGDDGNTTLHGRPPGLWTRPATTGGGPPCTPRRGTWQGARLRYRRPAAVHSE